MKRDHAKDVIAKGLEQLHAALAQGASEQLERYLAVMSKFHRYSFGNVMLILMQYPRATTVAGYQRWQQLGRQVKKGEKGIRILAPMRYRAKKDSNGEDEDEKQGGIRGFKVVHVWDVSQTEGEDLPEFAKTSGEPGDYLPRLEAAIATDSIQIVEAKLPAGCSGMSSGGTITLAIGLSPAERFRVLVHEFSHEKLHWGPRKHEASKPVKETEAEAVAFVVCNALGIDSAQRSSDYIQLHRGTVETLSESLEFIQKVATFILAALEGDELPEVKREEQSPAEQPACNHTLYLDEPGSTWTGEVSGKETRYSCSVCGRFYGYQTNGAKTVQQAPQPVDLAADSTTTEDADDPQLRIGRSDYHDRRDARIERLHERADQARNAANATHKRADDMAGVIPFGQPILVGHHSEGRDRRYRERIRKTFLKSFEFSGKATRLERRAQAAETSTAISSDDPDALEQLRERVRELDAIQEERKALNAAWRKAKKPKPDDTEGWKQVAATLEVDPKELGYVRMDMSRRSGWGMNDAPSPAYELSNNRQNITRLKARIQELEREGTITDTIEVDHGVCVVRQNVEVNRVQLVFPGKPSEEVRQTLKSYGFRWARSEGAWQRQLNQAGRHAATTVVQQLQRQGEVNETAQPS